MINNYLSNQSLNKYKESLNVIIKDYVYINDMINNYSLDHCLSLIKDF